MNIYRVNFKDNKPVSAAILGFLSYDKMMKSDTMYDKGKILWLPVLGFDEKDCIALAYKIVEDFPL